MITQNPTRLREEDIRLVEEMRYHLDKMLSRTSDQIIRLTQVIMSPPSHEIQMDKA